MFKYILSLFFIYLIIGLALFLLQRKIVFNRSGLPKAPFNYGLKNIKILSILTEDNIKLLAWFSNPRKNQPILVYFHGNSYDIGERASRIKRYIDQGWGVLLLSWRGYSGNLGTPTEKNLYKDGLASIKWILENTDVKKKDIILYGESLGCGVAVELGTKEIYKSIILEAPFKSIPEIAIKKYYVYPVKYFTLDKFDNLSKIKKILSPLLIINGKNDEVIPYNHGMELYKKANEPKKYVCLDEAMHNNLYDFDIDQEVIHFNLSL